MSNVKGHKCWDAAPEACSLVDQESYDEKMVIMYLKVKRNNSESQTKAMIPPIPWHHPRAVFKSFEPSPGHA